jgi:FkbM family methyltransferase
MLMRGLTFLRDRRVEARALGWRFLAGRFRRADDKGVITVNTRYGPLSYRPGDTDLEVLKQVFVEQHYNLDRFPQRERLQNELDRIIAAGETPVIIDAGANIGASSVWFARRFPETRVIAVEPDAANAALARANTAPYPNIEVVAAAIGSASGAVSLRAREGRSWAIRTERSAEGVPLVTVADLLSGIPRPRLLIVKIDIEGFEADLFADNTDWVSEAVAIVVEPHDWMLPGRGSSQSMQRALASQGREILIMGESLLFI